MTPKKRILPCSVAATLLASLWLALPVHAQQRPLRTEDPHLLPLGHVRLDFGTEFLQNQKFSLSGLEGDLTRVGVGSIYVGVGEYADFQISGVIRDFLSVSSRTTPVIPPNFAGNATSDVGDLVLASRLRFARESGARPALAFKFAVQLPNANNESGLGTDETQFFATLLAAKHFGAAEVLGNAGVAILGSAVIPNSQTDLLTYGVAFTFPVKRLELVAEVQGRHGAESLGNENQSQVRLGGRFRAAGLRWDLAGIAGLGTYDADSGVAFGVSFEFHAFNRKKSPVTVK